MNDAKSTDHQYQLSGGGLTYLLQRHLPGSKPREFTLRAQFLCAFALIWLPLLLLTLYENSFSAGTTARPLVYDMVPHVRFLIALPLLLLADLAIDPMVGIAIRNLEDSGIVPKAYKSQFRLGLEKLGKARDAVWPDIVMLVLAIAITWLFQPGYGDAAFDVAGTSWMLEFDAGSWQLTGAGWWYVLVSAPLFQFVLFRWLWRFLIWAGFLYRLSRIPLALQSTHPDLAGGLGILGLMQHTFTIVFVAFAAVMSSTIAHNILFEGDTFQASLVDIIAFIVASVVLIYAPLLFMFNKSYSARRRGLSQYGALGYKLSVAFSTKWVSDAKSNVGEELKASTDSSTMADFAATFDVVRSMRALPLSSRSILMTAAALLIPFVPLALTEYSIQDLFHRVISALV